MCTRQHTRHSVRKDSRGARVITEFIVLAAGVSIMLITITALLTIVALKEFQLKKESKSKDSLSALLDRTYTKKDAYLTGYRAGYEEGSRPSSRTPQLSIRVTPKPGEYWRHYKGGRYKIIAVRPNKADEHNPIVVYEDEHGEISHRSKNGDKGFMSLADKELSVHRFARISSGDNS